MARPMNRRGPGTMTADQFNVSLVVQRATREQTTPSDNELQAWATAALEASCGNSGIENFELSVRLVDEAESRELNVRYRDKDSATNVLSFPSDLPPAVAIEMAEQSGTRVLGDILICAPLVNAEAQEQGKDRVHHWAHLLVHGVLHLLGHDHLEAGQAETMESLEIAILGSMGIADPYRVSGMYPGHSQ